MFLYCILRFLLFLMAVCVCYSAVLCADGVFFLQLVESKEEFQQSLADALVQETSFTVNV